MQDGGRQSHTSLAARLLEAARQRGVTLGVAESDTGGLVLEWLTRVPGSSAVLVGGVVAYDNGLKERLLGVQSEVLERDGAVSQATVEAMASGARRACRADLGMATTGIAGPGGATPSKPVGTAWVAVAEAEGVVARGFCWRGGREANRRSSARAVLRLGLEVLLQRDAGKGDSS